ncbi:MAG: hypothetical protein IPH08_15370 [Rhodocyclaceae bacterium]|jgi:hypothetical protein|nr:hypothetical protein [Rhodocyclaceae bacterium]MBK6908382.1 hypothetical protein [Rhodocyclaceae bacterium]
MTSKVPRYEDSENASTATPEQSLEHTLADMRADVVALERAIHAGQDTTAIWNRLARCKYLLERVQ